MIWQVIHDGGTVECHTLQDAQREFARRENARIVELAPVDPLERAVVEAAVACGKGWKAEAWPTPEDFSRQETFRAAVSALIAAREGA